jgi:hypothetical protein
MDNKDINSDSNSQELSLVFLYSAIKSAGESVRSYDSKAQIVGIGYIFTVGIIKTIGDLNPDEAPFTQITILLAWMIAIFPILLYGAVLYPSRKTTPSIGAQHVVIKRLFFANSYQHNKVIDFLSDLKNADLSNELSYELLKLTTLRDLKRKRFLRALWASVFSFTLIMLSQLYQTTGSTFC